MKDFEFLDMFGNSTIVSANIMSDALDRYANFFNKNINYVVSIKRLDKDGI